MPRATIKDIARLAGVSVTTVSRALNDAPEISPETRERVLRICREQDYRINALARSLVSSRTGVLGVVLPDLSGPFHAALSLHLERYARDRGYQIMLCCGRPGDDRIDSLFDLLVRHRVDGSGSYNAFMSKFQKLVAQRGDGQYYVRGTFTKYNLDFAEDVLHLNRCGFDQISVEPVVGNPEMVSKK